MHSKSLTPFTSYCYTLMTSSNDLEPVLRIVAEYTQLCLSPKTPLLKALLNV